MPPPVPPPTLFLSYPENGSVNVSIAVGRLLFIGVPQGFYGNAAVSMVSTAGTAVPVGAYTAAPSPLPSPHAVPSGASGDLPYVAAPIPTLSPATSYALSETYTDFNGVPPTCTAPVTQSLGSFSTHSAAPLTESPETKNRWA